MSYHRPGSSNNRAENPFDDSGANPFENYEAYQPQSSNFVHESGDLGAQAHETMDDSFESQQTSSTRTAVLPYPNSPVFGAADDPEIDGLDGLPLRGHVRTNSDWPPGNAYGDEKENDDAESINFDRTESEQRHFSTRPVSLYTNTPMPWALDNGDSDTLTSTPEPEASAETNWARRQNLSRLHRYGTRKVNLVQGQVFRSEYPVPSAVHLSILPEYRAEDDENDTAEFSHMRYTAATVDPDEFTPENGYNLRIDEYGRETELLICITYYNEDKTLTARTLYGVMQNIRDICKLKRSAFWQNKDAAWKKICVVIVMDGIDPCDKNVLDVLATVGLYQDGVMKREVNGEETVAHIFEYTTQLCVSPHQRLIRPEEGNAQSLPPIQMILCLKQQNSKKINSHRWVFNAFCPILKPEVVVLVDAGTKPGPKSLLYLWQSFYNNKSVGGACGEIHAMLGNKKLALLNPLVASQNFEYKISNILDKPLESMFGYISVLPGAFSAYRYRAVAGRPLEQYFHGDQTLAKRLGKNGVDGMSIFRKNMFLAEDRILCLEVCFKRGENWHLTYVKESKAETDVPTAIPELLGQRRRWLNGSFAAGIYALMHFGRVYRSGHNILRIFMLHLQFCYNVLQQILSWFNLGCYYLTITIIIQLAANPKEYGSATSEHSFPFAVGASSIISTIVKYLYAMFLAISFILALGNKPKGSLWMYNVMLGVFGVIQIYSVVIALWLAATELLSIGDVKSISDLFGNFFTSTTALIIVALLSTYGLYIVTAVMYLDPWHILHSFIPYIFTQASFVNIVNVYAFCNWHDVSWGTKGSDTVGALPVVQAVKDGEKAVVEEVVMSPEDVDANFQSVVKRALAPHKPLQESYKRSADDDNRMFRTYLIVVWIISNWVLVWAITSTGDNALSMTISVRKRISYFFAVLLWSNAVVAIVRFLGCASFITTSLVRRIFNRK